MPVHVPNLRDVGGLAAADGARVRRGQVLRSALPQHDDTVPDHIPWPPALVLDLRSPIEHDGGHPLAPLGPRLVNLPLLQALRPGWHESGTLVSLYELVLDEAGHLLVDLVHHVAEAPGPALVHCAAGKDRTGISIALLLRLLGVEREDVVADYLLTGRATAAIDSRLRRDDTAVAVPAAFLAVPREAIELTLDRWDAHAGGAQGWFLTAGGDPARLEALRSRLLA